MDPLLKILKVAGRIRRLRHDRRIGIPHLNKPPGILVGKRPQQHPFNNTEDRGIRADAQSKSHYCRSAESPNFSNSPESVSEFPPDRFHHKPSNPSVSEDLRNVNECEAGNSPP